MKQIKLSFYHSEEERQTYPARASKDKLVDGEGCVSNARIDKSLDALHRAKWFSTCDVASGFHQTCTRLFIYSKILDEHVGRQDTIFPHLHENGLKRVWPKAESKEAQLVSGKN